MKQYYLMPSLDQEMLAPALRVVQEVAASPFVSSFKVGFSLGLSAGLGNVVHAIRKHSDKPIVYDHQKAATDIPDTGSLFARTMKSAGITEAILFPQAGPTTLTAWIRALFDVGVIPVVGAIMTHATYLQSEGGYLGDGFAQDVFGRATELGVTKFVVPLTKPELVAKLSFPTNAVFYSPGFGAQGGDPLQFPAQREHHLISGRALFAAHDRLAYVREQARLLGAIG